MCEPEAISLEALYEAYPDQDVLPITPPTEKTSYESMSKSWVSSCNM